MNALIVGASTGVGRALSDALAARGDSLLLVADNEDDLNAQSAHLRLWHGVRVMTVAADARQPDAFLDCVRSGADQFGPVEALLFPIGASRLDDRGQLSPVEAGQLVGINLLSVVNLVGHFLPGLLAAGQGHIVGFSSVAAIRGRSANMVYAAAKRGLESYFEGLRHLTSQTRIHVQCYRLGYVATQQSFGRKFLFPLARPENVARAVVHHLASSRTFLYYPPYWSLIAPIVSMAPWQVFRRLNF